MSNRRCSNPENTIFSYKQKSQLEYLEPNYNYTSQQNTIYKFELQFFIKYSEQEKLFNYPMNPFISKSFSKCL